MTGFATEEQRNAKQNNHEEGELDDARDKGRGPWEPLRVTENPM